MPLMLPLYMLKLAPKLESVEIVLPLTVVELVFQLVLDFLQVLVIRFEEREYINFAHLGHNLGNEAVVGLLRWVVNIELSYTPPWNEEVEVVSLEFHLVWVDVELRFVIRWLCLQISRGISGLFLSAGSHLL